MATQPITGYPSSWRAPFTAAELLFNQGPVIAASGGRSVIYIMPRSSVGDWTAGVVYDVSSEEAASLGAGPGSPLHRAIRMHLRANKRGRVLALPYDETTGAGATAATGAIDFNAPAPDGRTTGAGVVSFTVAAVTRNVGFRKGATADEIATSIATAINAQTQLPCTAVAVGPTVTLTARIAGASQGDGTVGVVRFRVTTQSGRGLVVATSGAALGLGAGAAGADGTTAEVDQLTTALQSIENSRHYYMAFSAWDAASLAVVKEHIVAKSSPAPGLRSVGISASTDVLAATTTRAILLNSERMQIVWQRASEHDPAELAANMAAVRQKREEIHTAYNFNGYSGDDWFVLPAASDADFPDADDMNDAITDGLTPIASGSFGSSIGMSVTTRSKDSTGAMDDFRSSESHRVSVMDDFVDTVLIRHTRQFGGNRLAPDRKLADGSVDHNQIVPPGVLVPSRYKLPLIVAGEFVDAGKLQDIGVSRDSFATNIDPQNVGRLEVGIVARVIDWHNQTTMRIAEVTPG
jgi:phage tail sheath gpL-like